MSIIILYIRQHSAYVIPFENVPDSLSEAYYEHVSLKLRNCRRVSIYVPESSSTLQRFMEWLTGRRPELIDPAILASGGGRERKEMHRDISH